MSNTLNFTVNGAELTIDADPQAALLSVLRERLDLTGAKLSCGEGACGACTVLVDDQPVRACVTPAIAAAGKRVLTIEGLADGERLHPLQRAFVDADAFQCGYCTPGMIMAGVRLLLEHPDPDVETIVSFMQGNICRCGMYARIVRAIQGAAAELRADPAAGGER
jgi:aerobic-type carbon monoxide dehydrogenase small subunit (CoxS/CutS family)